MHIFFFYPEFSGLFVPGFELHIFFFTLNLASTSGAGPAEGKEDVYGVPNRNGSVGCRAFVMSTQTVSHLPRSFPGVCLGTVLSPAGVFALICFKHPCNELRGLLYVESDLEITYLFSKSGLSCLKRGFK